MPKSPILSRDGFYVERPGGLARLLDWNIVNTSLGAMFEPRQLNVVPIDGFSALNSIDGGFTRLTPVDVEPHADLHSGPQVPISHSS